MPTVAAPAAALDPLSLAATPLSPDSTFSGVKSASAHLADTDPSLLGQTSSDPVNVMIKYDYDPTASYEGGVSGLPATSPRKTGKSLEENQSAVQAYESYTEAKSHGISDAVKQAVPSAEIGKTFYSVYGGVQATIPANQVAAVLQVPGVTAVQKDNLEHPLAQDDATTFVGAAAVWPSLGGEAHAGQGVVVGLLDTGIWPESPFFADNGLPAPATAHACQFGDGTDTAHLGSTFQCNHKLIGAYAFTNTYMAVVGSDGHEFCNDATKTCSTRDPEGHGTHTASTAAGDLVSSALMYGVDRGPVSGMAPGAEVIEFRICMQLGCFNSDSVAAIAQAIKDGVNVISYSISGGANPYTDPVELAFRDAFNAGITVSASAGNSGPGAGTTDHGGPWVVTVGASTSDRFFTSTLNLTASNGDHFSMSGVTITNGVTTATPVVLAESIAGEDAKCQTPLAAGSATGKLVACLRGTNARVDKGFNVSRGGAAGMILYNAVKQDVETDNHWLPAIHVDGPDTALLAFINGHTGVTGTFASGTPSATQGDVMASFSSRGPSAFFLKPDITAPGIQVLAGMTPQPDPTITSNGPPGNLFQAIAGTSMSAPHVAGSAALIKATHPSWTPAEIKSALMTSAAQDVVKEDGVTAATPFDAGAGGLRVNRAVNPTLVFNETFADYVASGSDPLGRVNLNLPSVDATTMSGKLTTKRTAINVSGVDQRLRVTVQQPAGATITVGRRNESLSIDNGESLTFSITISAPSVPDGQYFGRITLTSTRSGYNAVTIPVAFFKRQGAVTLTQNCAPTAITTSASSHCSATVSNLAATPASAKLTVSGQGLRYSNVTAPAKGTQHGLTWSGTLTPSIPPQVTSVALGTTANNGYFPLSTFGVNFGKLSGVGDDTITNLTVPAFFYGGESYTQLGVGSNGYLVVGGGGAADVSARPQIFPNPNRPNNVIAPFWTDLNPPAGGSIRAAVLTDTVSHWIVIDWDHVVDFSEPVQNTFEVWIRTGTSPSSEQISIEYLTTGKGDTATGVNWGAENRDGTSGKNIAAPGPANGTSWVVTLTGPTPGGHQTVQYDVSSEEGGTFTSMASMTSNLTAGVTEVPQVITVTQSEGDNSGPGVQA
jgi:subtilisin family serine protease